MNLYQYIIGVCVISLLSCSGLSTEESVLIADEYQVDSIGRSVEMKEDNPQAIVEEEQSMKLDTFGRAIIEEHLKEKIAARKPLVIHVHIPLCDNEHQGIVPTSASLGDGQSTRTNLYWATSSGTKKYFQKHTAWRQIYNERAIDTNILERIIFEREYGKIKVYLVADAYRGDRMEETINDYLGALACERQEILHLKESNQAIPLSGGADLLIFNGHNGMMDNVTIQNWVNKSDKRKDAVINACATYGYFEEELRRAKAYPLLRTTNLLHPGAYVLTEVIDDWVNQKSLKVIAKNANKAYCKTQGCKRTRLYKEGWNIEDFPINN